VRASRDVDSKDVFTLSGRGFRTCLIVHSASGLLKNSTIAATDKAMSVCPVGALLVKRQSFRTPIGERTYGQREINEVSLEHDQAIVGEGHG
jgi:[NiFe] hydrogenase diaphorase moiety small subunit